MLPSTNPVSEGSTSCPVVFCMRRDWRDSWGLGYINVQEFTWWFLGFLGFSMTPTFKLWQWICIDILYIYISVILLLLIHPMIQDVTVKRTLHHDFTGQDFFLWNNLFGTGYPIHFWKLHSEVDSHESRLVPLAVKKPGISPCSGEIRHVGSGCVPGLSTMNFYGSVSDRFRCETEM